MVNVCIATGYPTTHPDASSYPKANVMDMFRKYIIYIERYIRDTCYVSEKVTIARVHLAH